MKFRVQNCKVDDDDLRPTVVAIGQFPNPNFDNQPFPKGPKQPGLKGRPKGDTSLFLMMATERHNLIVDCVMFNCVR